MGDGPTEIIAHLLDNGDVVYSMPVNETTGVPPWTLAMGFLPRGPHHFEKKLV